MTFTPPTLRELGAYWAARGGVNLGSVGDMRHCSGYHLGEDRIFGDCACKPDGTCEPGKGLNDYSVQFTRDRNGLSDAASALDLGRLGGSLPNLYAFSRWLVQQARTGAPGTRDIREVIYWNPIRGRVERYSGVDGLIHWGPGNGNLSHKTHTHISYWRDSEFRDKTVAFAPYFELPDTATEEPMGPELISTEPFIGVVTIKDDGISNGAIRLRDGKVIWLPEGHSKPVFAKGVLKTPWPDHPSGVVYICEEDPALLLAEDLSNVTQTAGFTKAQVDAAVQAAVAPLNTRITTIKGKVAAVAADIAND